MLLTHVWIPSPGVVVECRVAVRCRAPARRHAPSSKLRPNSPRSRQSCPYSSPGPVVRLDRVALRLPPCDHSSQLETRSRYHGTSARLSGETPWRQRMPADGFGSAAVSSFSSRHVAHAVRLLWPDARRTGLVRRVQRHDSSAAPTTARLAGTLVGTRRVSSPPV